MANDKIISTSALIDKFKQALADKWGYIWGSAGTMWTAEKQKNLEKTTDSQFTNAKRRKRNVPTEYHSAQNDEKPN